MKKCDSFKELILTDFIDGELNKDLAKSVESHLLDCSLCRAFFKEVKSNTSVFQHIAPQEVPAELWDAIKQNIEQKNQALNPVADVLDRLKALLVFPRLVPVFASLMVMLLAGSVTFNTMQINQAKEKDQGEYLVALLNPAGALAQTDVSDSGTPIEHYFL